MQKSPRQSWHRMLLASIVVLTIGGAGMSFAGSGPGYSKPQYGVIIGTATPAVGVGSNYSLYVEFTDASNGTVGAANGVVWSGGAPGSFSGNTYTPTLAQSGKRALISATYASAGASVSTNRVVTPM